ncbi:hypothetical protein TKK_0010247 [Trichogramma kaykai]
MSDGQREQQAPKSARGDGEKNRSKSGSQLPLPTMIGSTPLMTAAAITRKILGTPLVTSKDAPYPTDKDYATGGYEKKCARIEGLVCGLASFFEPKGNLYNENLPVHFRDVCSEQQAK